MKPLEIEEYSEFFRSMRKVAGLTVRQMADEVGVSRSAWSNYEAGLFLPKDIDPLEKRVRSVVKSIIKKGRQAV